MIKVDGKTVRLEGTGKELARDLTRILMAFKKNISPKLLEVICFQVILDKVAADIVTVDMEALKNEET